MDGIRRTVHIPAWVPWFKQRWYELLRSRHPGHPFSDGDLSTVFDHRHAVCMAWFNCLVANYAPNPLPGQVGICRARFELAINHCGLDPAVQHFDHYFRCCIVDHARSGALALFEQQLATGEVPHLAEELLEQHLAQGLGEVILGRGPAPGLHVAVPAERPQGLYDMPIDKRGQMINGAATGDRGHNLYDLPMRQERPPGLYDMPIDERGQVIRETAGGDRGLRDFYDLPIRERAPPRGVGIIVGEREQGADLMVVDESQPEREGASDA